MSLESNYVFSEDNVAGFIEEHPSYRDVLLRSIDPLRKYFGADKTFLLKLSYEDGDPTLYCVILWPGSVQSAAAARSAFDDEWWLEHMNPDTCIVFVYQLV